MATLNIYAIKDNQTPCFPQLFFALSDAVATRTVAQILQQDTQLSTFPEHFDLYHIGSVDQISGMITSVPDHVGPRFICGLVTLNELIRRSQPKGQNHDASQ